MYVDCYKEKRDIQDKKKIGNATNVNIDRFAELLCEVLHIHLCHAAYEGSQAWIQGETRQQCIRMNLSSRAEEGHW
jgi:hypothetical protein